MKPVNELKFRCSGLHLIMGNPEKSGGLTDKQTAKVLELQGKPTLTDKQKIELAELLAKRKAAALPSFTEAEKKHLADLWVSFQYGRHEELDNRFIRKGNGRELEAMAMYSAMLGVMWQKNTQRITNEFITGECDSKRGEGLNCQTIDIKCSYSLFTFTRIKVTGISPANIWQGHGYMWLYDSHKHTVVHCLMNGLPDQIEREKKYAYFATGQNFDNDEYIQRCKQIEINHIFNRAKFEEQNPDWQWHIERSEWTYDIDRKQRIIANVIERDPTKFNQIQTRATQCREWMQHNLK